MKTASWVIRRKSNKEALFETFNPEIPEKLNKEVYEAVPILEYLQEVARLAKMKQRVETSKKQPEFSRTPA